jgi:hypothetical protein
MRWLPGRKYWGLGILNLFSPNWVATRQAAMLFLGSSLMVLATTPIYLGKMGSVPFAAWEEDIWLIVGILGTLCIFFLWGGMLQYWRRVDLSSKWAKRLSLVILIAGLWWGACLYCYVVYVPQVFRGKSSR